MKYLILLILFSGCNQADPINSIMRDSYILGCVDNSTKRVIECRKLALEFVERINKRGAE